MSQTNYEALRPTLEAIADADALSPNMPVARFLQEAADLHVWSTPDQPALVAVGVPQETFTTLEDRIGALRYAQSVWAKDRHGQDEARQEWDTRLPDALALKNQLEHAFRFAFRDRQDLLSKVHAIEQGTGHQDMLQDLSDLSVLGKANEALLTAVNFDLTLLDTAATQSSEMSELLATMNGDRATNSVSILMRDKAYTYLKQAVDAIREAGKYVFWKDAVRKKGYRSVYHNR